MPKNPDASVVPEPDARSLSRPFEPDARSLSRPFEPDTATIASEGRAATEQAVENIVESIHQISGSVRDGLPSRAEINGMTERELFFYDKGYDDALDAVLAFARCIPIPAPKVKS